MELSGKISIIIPTYNRKNDLMQCLASVKNLLYYELEIVVVDNASTDGTYENVKKVFPQVKIIRNNKNLGVSGGRNTGLKYINKNTKFILFLDHDIIVEKDLVNELLKVMNKDEKMGIATPKIYYYEDKSVIWAVGTSINLITGKITMNGENQRDEGQFNQIRDVQVAPAVIMVKREVIQKIGGFDEDYFATYEDTDFCFRAKKVGYRIIYVPRARAFHKVPLNWWESKKRLVSRNYYIARNRIIFMKKYSHYFFLFFFFLPVYFFYYSYLSLLLKQKERIKDFLKGTISGLKFITKIEK